MFIQCVCLQLKPVDIFKNACNMWSFFVIIECKKFQFLFADLIEGAESQSVSISCGQNIKLTDIAAVLKDDNVIYFDNEFWTNKRVFRMDKSGVLNITSVIPEDSGVYKCLSHSGIIKIHNLTGMMMTSFDR